MPTNRCDPLLSLLCITIKISQKSHSTWNPHQIVIKRWTTDSIVDAIKMRIPSCSSDQNKKTISRKQRMVQQIRRHFDVAVTWTRMWGGLALTEEIFPTFRFIRFAFHSLIYSRPKCKCTLSTLCARVFCSFGSLWKSKLRFALFISHIGRSRACFGSSTGKQATNYSSGERTIVTVFPARSLTALVRSSRRFLSKYIFEIIIINKLLFTDFRYFCFLFYFRHRVAVVVVVVDALKWRLFFTVTYVFLDKIFNRFVFLTTRLCWK